MDFIFSFHSLLQMAADFLFFIVFVNFSTFHCFFSVLVFVLQKALRNFLVLLLLRRAGDLAPYLMCAENRPSCGGKEL